MARLGIMSFAHMHAAGYAHAIRELPNVELVGVADDDRDRGRKMADQFGAAYFGSYAELLKQDIDAVIVCPGECATSGAYRYGG